MPPLSDELAKRRQFISSVRWDEVNERLRALAEWLLSTPALAQIVDLIERTAPAEPILARRKPRMPPPAGTPEEVASIGLHILRQVRGGHDTWTYVSDLEIRPPYGSGHAQDTIAEVLERFILPTLDHIYEHAVSAEAGGTLE